MLTERALTVFNEFKIIDFIFQGQVFSGADYRVYLLGNPVSVFFEFGFK